MQWWVLYLDTLRNLTDHALSAVCRRLRPVRHLGEWKAARARGTACRRTNTVPVGVALTLLKLTPRLSPSQHAGAKAGCQLERSEPLQYWF